MTTNTYDQLLSYVVFADWLFFGLTAGALLIVRRRDPQARGEIAQAPGHPFTTVAFVLVAAGIVMNSFFAYPDAVAHRVGILAAGHRRVFHDASTPQAGPMKTFPELAYIAGRRRCRRPRINLARSGIDLCPPSLLRLGAPDLVTTLPVQ